MRLARHSVRAAVCVMVGTIVGISLVIGSQVCLLTFQLDVSAGALSSSSPGSIAGEARPSPLATSAIASGATTVARKGEVSAQVAAPATTFTSLASDSGLNSAAFGWSWRPRGPNLKSLAIVREDDGSEAEAPDDYQETKLRQSWLQAYESEGHVAPKTGLSKTQARRLRQVEARIAKMAERSSTLEARQEALQRQMVDLAKAFEVDESLDSTPLLAQDYGP